MEFPVLPGGHVKILVYKTTKTQWAAVLKDKPGLFAVETDQSTAIKKVKGMVRKLNITRNRNAFSVSKVEKEAAQKVIDSFHNRTKMFYRVMFSLVFLTVILAAVCGIAIIPQVPFGFLLYIFFGLILLYQIYMIRAKMKVVGSIIF